MLPFLFTLLTLLASACVLMLMLSAESEDDEDDVPDAWPGCVNYRDIYAGQSQGTSQKAVALPPSPPKDGHQGKTVVVIIPFRDRENHLKLGRLKHWRKINGFGNNYFGWGGEDDELHHRLRLGGLLYGDCYPYCKKNDPNVGKPGQSIHRPKKGFGRFSGKFMHSANHTKRITDRLPA
eukprot:s2901_g8.t1